MHAVVFTPSVPLIMSYFYKNVEFIIILNCLLSTGPKKKLIIKLIFDSKYYTEIDNDLFLVPLIHVIISDLLEFTKLEKLAIIL